MKGMTLWMRAKGFVMGVLLLFTPLLAHSDPIYPHMPQTEIEARLAQLIASKLNLNAKLRPSPSQDNMVIEVTFSESLEAGFPASIILVDTHVLSRNQVGEPVALTIAISGAPLSEIDNSASVAEWINEWNSQPLPTRAYLAGGNLVIASNIIATQAVPATEEQFLQQFSFVLQGIPVAVQQLEKLKR